MQSRRNLELNKFKVGDVVTLKGSGINGGRVGTVIYQLVGRYYKNVVSFNLDAFGFINYNEIDFELAVPNHGMYELCSDMELELSSKVIGIDDDDDDDDDDDVNHPSHYTQGSIETIKLIEELLGKQGFIDYCMGNVVKYTQRHKHKGKPLKDLKKAQFYLNELIEKMEGNENE